MPRVLYASNELRSGRKRGREEVCRHLVQTTSERTGDILYVLWQRLVGSFQCLSPRSTTALAKMRQETSLTSCTRTQDKRERVCESNTDSIRAIITHLYYVNREYDTLSWVIAFCLLEKLQQEFSIHLPLVSVNAERCQGHSDEHVLNVTEHLQTLLALYCLACKWHMDYLVTVKYVVRHAQQCETGFDTNLLDTLARLERRAFDMLDHNCAVRRSQVVQLLHRFLSVNERQSLLFAAAPLV